MSAFDAVDSQRHTHSDRTRRHDPAQPELAGMGVAGDSGIIAAFNYCIAVAKSVPFHNRFLEMTGLSLSVAAFSFLVGLLLRTLFGVDV